MKLNSAFDVEWSLACGGPLDDSFAAVAPAHGGGYVACGRTSSYGAGSMDAWVVAFDDSGSVVWQRAFGHASDDAAHAMVQDTPGGYLVAGTWGPDGAAHETGWLLELRDDGSVQRQFFREATSDETSTFRAVVLARDRGVVLAGSRSYPSPLGTEPRHLIAFKLSVSRQFDWLLEATEGYSDQADSLVARPGGGYLAFGRHGEPRPGGDISGQVLAISDDGVALWQRGLTRTHDDRLAAGMELLDGRIAMVGRSGLLGGDADGLLATFDADGSYRDGATLGGELAAVVELGTGLVMAGNCSSMGQGRRDGLLVVSGSQALPCGALANLGGLSTVGYQSLTSTDATRFRIFERVLSVETLSNATTVPFIATTADYCQSGALPLEVSPPSSLSPLRLRARGALTWEAGIFSGSTEFCLYRGRLARLPLGDFGECLATNIPAPAFTDADLPGVSSAFFYLVAGRNVTGDGPLGSTSRGMDRLAALPCP